MLFSSYSILKKYLMSEFSFASFIETNCFHFSHRSKKIREKVDYVYRHLQHLCNILEENDSDEVYDMNSDSIRIDKSNELLDGMKELFKQSTYEEQVRLMTIAPDNWGRTAIAQWFGASDHHARQSILLRRDRGVLAFPEYTRGNKFLDEDTVQSVVQFYLQDGVSRVSSNSKDVLKIKNELVPVRFMEMSIRETLRKSMMIIQQLELENLLFTL